MEKEFSAIDVSNQLAAEFKLIQNEFKAKCDAFEKRYEGVTVMYNHIEGIDEKEESWSGLAIDFDYLEKIDKLFKSKPLISGELTLVNENRIIDLNDLVGVIESEKRRNKKQV